MRNIHHKLSPPRLNSLTASAPACATCASCSAAAPDTPIPLTILPPEKIGTPPWAKLAPKASTRRPTPPPATASSSALAGGGIGPPFPPRSEAKLARRSRLVFGYANSGQLRVVEPLQHH